MFLKFAAKQLSGADVIFLLHTPPLYGMCCFISKLPTPHDDLIPCNKEHFKWWAIVWCLRLTCTFS